MAIELLSLAILQMMPAPPAAPASNYIIVTNNTQKSLTCRQEYHDGTTSQPETIESGGEYYVETENQSVRTARIHCASPVIDKTFRIRVGGRYAFLQIQDDPQVQIRLVE